MLDKIVHDENEDGSSPAPLRRESVDTLEKVAAQVADALVQVDSMKVVEREARMNAAKALEHLRTVQNAFDQAVNKFINEHRADGSAWPVPLKVPTNHGEIVQERKVLEEQYRAIASTAAEKKP